MPLIYININVRLCSWNNALEILEFCNKIFCRKPILRKTFRFFRKTLFGNILWQIIQSEAVTRRSSVQGVLKFCIIHKKHKWQDLFNIKLQPEYFYHSENFNNILPQMLGWNPFTLLDETHLEAVRRLILLRSFKQCILWLLVGSRKDIWLVKTASNMKDLLLYQRKNNMMNTQKAGQGDRNTILEIYLTIY